MSKKETTIESELIERLTLGKSQWTYCENLKTEEDLWNNFKNILENNNRDKLNDIPITEIEFKRIKNQIVCSSFYDAGVKLIGEQGIFHAKIERKGNTINLDVFNRYQKAGGSTVYQIINQFQAFQDDSSSDSRNRRFDVTFLINGLPLIHLELKNGRHASYHEGFRQIQKYINEGHFKGIFSLIQMFIVSNKVQTKYIAANEILNKEFLTSWTEEDNPDMAISDLFEFSKKVLGIPEAHEMITDYCQLDFKNKKVMLLRPYQIQAIQAMRNASHQEKSGYIWHATGSGKTLTSYKAARNLLLDKPNIDKTIFLIDRKDLDEKTCDDFDSYANGDTIDVVGTDDTSILEKKLLENKREMIVTTIQKLQRIIKKTDDKKLEKISNKHIAFVVDECHRTVTLNTQIEIKGFFPKNLWYGFTGTPIFVENQGSLDSTTKKMYGDPLHSYTIKNALHDKSVLGFLVERLGEKSLTAEDNDENKDFDNSVYEKEKHKLDAINIIINKSNSKFGITNGPGRSYEALLTTGRINKAQQYYDLFKMVKNNEIPEIKINDEIKRMLDDFPKVAITYSTKENTEESSENSNKLKQAIEDYNKMFGTTFDLSSLDAYNTDLTERFSRKDDNFQSRKQQLDIVIVADRLLTGFNAPCLSTIFLDRPPMNSHSLIQAFSRTNRLFDKNKTTGNVVTFQYPNKYKTAIDEAIKLFSKGGQSELIAPSFEEIEKKFIEAIIKLRSIAEVPNKCSTFGSENDKKNTFCKAFQNVDTSLSKIRGYIEWNEKDMEKDYNLSIDEYYSYAAWYHNFKEELKDSEDTTPSNSDTIELDYDYELLSYGKDNINYLYVVRLIEDYLKTGKSSKEDIEKSLKILSEISPKLGETLRELWEAVYNNPEEYIDKNLTALFEQMKKDTVKNALKDVSEKYCLNIDDVEYSANLYCNQFVEDLPMFTSIKENSNPLEYIEKTGEHLMPFEYFILIRKALIDTFNDYVLPFKDLD